MRMSAPSIIGPKPPLRSRSGVTAMAIASAAKDITNIAVRTKIPARPASAAMSFAIVPLLLRAPAPVAMKRSMFAASMVKSSEPARSARASARRLRQRATPSTVGNTLPSDSPSGVNGARVAVIGQFAPHSVQAQSGVSAKSSTPLRGGCTGDAPRNACPHAAQKPSSSNGTVAFEPRWRKTNHQRMAVYATAATANGIRPRTRPSWRLIGTPPLAERKSASP